MTFIGLDLETAPNEGQPQVFALQPWRAQEGKAHITCMSVAALNHPPALILNQGNDIRNELYRLRGKTCVTWNGIFDLAWLIASGHLGMVQAINWQDGMLLWKWVDNSQNKEYYDPHWSLVDGCRRWLKDVSWINDFIELKANEPPPGQDDAYWERRAKLDAIVTQMIAERCWAVLTSKQRNSAAIEAKCIIPNATSWLRGIKMDYRAAAKMKPEVTKEMREIEFSLGVSNLPDPVFELGSDKPESTEIWTPSSILRSPQKKVKLLYEDWGLTCKYKTKGGAPSTDKTALTYLADVDDRALELLRWSQLNTQYTKFILGIEKTKDYLKSSISHPGPKIFSTYTGRMTYSTKTSSKGDGAKAKVGVPIHQWPRLKVLRSLILPPPGKALIEFDAAGQESRIISDLAQEQTMMAVFNSPPPYDDLHSYTGSKIAGMGFESFIKLLQAKNESVAGPKGYRYQGKFSNLSLNYRIGVPSFRRKSRVDYGMDASFLTVQGWKDTYLRTYPGIKTHWAKEIEKAKTLGFAESLGGRRFKIHQWNKENSWQSEQTAINFPVQATGGDQKELALMILTEDFPEFDFAFDLHDGLFFYADINDQLLPLMTEARDILNNIDYEKYWGWEPSIPMLWDAAVGIDWGKMRGLK